MSGASLSPAVPQVTDMVTSGVRLPSHISAFGETSSDERLDGDDTHFLPEAGNPGELCQLSSPTGRAACQAQLTAGTSET